jgi:hypothetical protein
MTMKAKHYGLDTGMACFSGMAQLSHTFSPRITETVGSTAKTFLATAHTSCGVSLS